MNINYVEIGAVVLIALAVILWLIMRNQKDEKAFEKDELDSPIADTDPEKE